MDVKSIIIGFVSGAVLTVGVSALYYYVLEPSDDGGVHSDVCLNTNTIGITLGSVEESSEEDSRLRCREFCVIESIGENYFYVKNTVDEMYKIDKSFLGDHKTGDNIVLIYYDRTLTDEDVYVADVKSVEKDSNILLYPAGW